MLTIMSNILQKSSWTENKTNLFCLKHDGSGGEGRWFGFHHRVGIQGTEGRVIRRGYFLQSWQRSRWLHCNHNPSRNGICYDLYLVKCVTEKGYSSQVNSQQREVWYSRYVITSVVEVLHSYKHFFRSENRKMSRKTYILNTIHHNNLSAELKNSPTVYNRVAHLHEYCSCWFY